MDTTLRQVGQLLLDAIPTVVLLLLLYVIYQNFLRKPMERVLAQRRERTEGAVAQARAEVATAESRTQEYEHKLREARLAIFKAQDARRQQAQQLRTQALAEARQRAQQQLQEAKVAIDRAARLGDAWLCGPVESFNRIMAMKSFYDEKCLALARTPDWVLRRYVWIAPEAVTIERDILPAYIEGLLGHWRESTTDPENIEIIRRIDAGGPIPTKQIADDRLLWGDPESIVRQIEDLRRKTGLDHLIVAFGTGLPAHSDLNGRSIAGFEEVVKMLRLFAREVMPAFK